MRGQPLGEIERRRPADIVRQMAVHLALERRIGLGLGIGLLQFEDQRHQRLGDEAAAVDAEMPALVGAGAERIGLLQRASCACSQVLRPSALSATRAARMKARILSGSFSPGARSTPDDTSTAGARVIRKRLGDVAGVEPARQHERHAGIDVLQQASSRTSCRGRRAASPRAARARRTAAGRRPWRRAGSATDRRAVSIGSAFITGRPKRERTAATRSGVSLPCSCSMSGLSASTDAVELGVGGIDRQRDLLGAALHPLAQARAPPRCRGCAATAERTRSRPCRRRRPAPRRARRGSSGRRF